MDELTPEQLQRLDEEYGDFTNEQLDAHLAAVNAAIDAKYLDLFNVTAELFRRDGRVLAIRPELEAWWRLGLDLTRVGLVDADSDDIF